MRNRSEIIDNAIRDFPEAAAILSYEADDPPLHRKFISVFDQWLGKENSHMLDCKDESERDKRNDTLLAHWSRVFDRTSVIRVQEGMLRLETDKDSFLDYCRYRWEKSSAEFAFVLLPELGAYYKEDWDDTNVVWYRDESCVQPLYDWAAESGLYVLDEWAN